MALLTSRAGLLSLASLLLLPAASGYVWPDPKVDGVEFQLYEQQGFNFLQFTSFAEVILPPNPTFDPELGINRAAMWLRVAYHDMATHNVTDGTGGLDGSIVFETDRAENIGNAFVITISDLSGATSTRCSFSDNLAIAAIVAAGITSNGSVIVPFSGGRIDAIEAGLPGVPEPQQDLATHTEKFANQGFNVSEMIALVACGHTIGGVHGVDFPTIVPVPPDHDNSSFDQVTQNFDADTGDFNNNIASQFVAKVPQNPLAFGDNETTRSDARIFGADGGDMISRMAASNEFFQDTCNTLIERMVNTVPKGVTLVDISSPYVVKPIQLYAAVNSNGTMTVSGILRILSNAPGDSTGGVDRQVVVHLSPRGGSICSSTQACTAATATTNSQMVGGAGYPNLSQFIYYAFEAEVPAEEGVSSFVVETIDAATGTSTIHDNEGHAFPYQDALLPQKPSSCRVQFGDNGPFLNLSVAVRDAPQYTAVDLLVPVPSPTFSIIPSQFATSTVALEAAATVAGTDYTLFTGTFSWPFTRAQPTGHPYDVVASGEGVKAEALFYPWGDLPDC